MAIGRRALARAMLALVLAGCGRCGPAPDPATLLMRAADDLAASRSLHFTLIRDGRPVVIEPASGIAFDEADGDYRAPDRVRARVKVSLGSLLTTVDAIWLPEGVFVTDPLTGVYRRVPSGLALDPAAVFRADGIPAVLRGEVRKATLVAREDLDGVDAFHIQGEVDGARLRALTGGAVVAGTHRVDVWIDAARGRLLRVQDREPGEGGAWRLDLGAFDRPVEINPP